MGIQGNEAPVRGLGSYLSKDTERVLRVPSWQREYVWKAKDGQEVGTLLEDLKTFVDEKEDDYLFGTIFLSRIENSVNDRLIIDGQQRTLTFLILIMAVLKYIENFPDEFPQDLPSDENALNEETLTIMRKCISNHVAHYRPRLSMSHRRADDIMQQIFFWAKMRDGMESDTFLADRDDWTQTQRNLVEVATWIYEKKLRNKQWIPNSELLPGFRHILDNVKIIEVTLETEQEAIAVFDRMNSRGANLDSGDLIKNIIFASVDEDDFQTIAAHWMEMTDHISGASLKRLKEPKFLLRALALADAGNLGNAEVDTESSHKTQTAPKITYEGLIKYWGQRLKTPESSQEDLTQKADPIKFAKELEIAGKWLRNLSHERTLSNKPLHDLYFSRFLSSVQHYPVLLAGRNISDLDVLKHLVRQVHNRTAYYLLSEERTQDFEAMIPSWAALISKLGDDVTKDELDEIYELRFKATSEQIEALTVKMRTWNVKSSDKKRIRAVLAHLSRQVDLAGRRKEIPHSPHVYFNTNKDKEGVTWDIDHIQPQKGESRDSAVHLIGNLVLLRADHNQLKRARAPEEKSDVYMDSALLLTKTLVQITVVEERKRVSNFFEKAGIKSYKANLKNWNDHAQKQRADLYCDLLRYSLSNLD